MNKKICIIGDSGTNTETQKRVALALEAEGCNQIRHTGDIIYEDGIKDKNDPLIKTHFIDHYGNLLKNQIPIFLSLGNHDYKGNPDAWLNLNNQYIRFPSKFYISKYQDICIIMIDTISQFLKQAFWLNKMNKNKLNDCKMKITIGHHPRYSSGKHGMNSILVNQIFLDNFVLPYTDLYVSGHEHHLEDIGKRDSTHFMISGAAGYIRPLKKKHFHWAQASAGYLVLKLIKNQLSYTFRVVNKDNTVHNAHTGLIALKNN